MTSSRMLIRPRPSPGRPPQVAPRPGRNPLALEAPGLLPLAGLVDRFNVAIGGLLKLSFAALEFVLGDILVAFEFPQRVLDVPADVAHGHPGIFTTASHQTDQLEPKFLRQGRGLETDDLAVVVRGEPPIRSLNR